MVGRRAQANPMPRTGARGDQGNAPAARTGDPLCLVPGDDQDAVGP